MLFFDELAIADHLQGAVENRLVVPAVVVQRLEVLIEDDVIVGEVVGPQEVAAPDLGPFDPELVGGEVEQPFDDEDAVLPAGATVGRHRDLVGEDRLELARVGRHVVRSHGGALAVQRHREAVGIEGAAVVEKGVLQAENPAVGRQRQLGLVNLAALLGRGVEVFPPVLDPFHRPPQLPRQPGDDHLLGIEHHDLRPESATDERSHDTHLSFVETEHRGEAVANRDRCLGGVPDGQPAGTRVPFGNHTPVLDRRRGPPVVDQPPPDDDRCLLPSLFVVTLALDDVGCHVRSDIVVDQRCRVVERPLDIDDGRKRLVVDRDPLRRVLGECPALGHHDSHRLAQMPHLVSCQRYLGALVEDRAFDGRRGNQQRAPLVVVAEIVRGDDRHHALHLACCGDVDATQPCVGMGTPHERHVEHLRELYVIDEQCLSGEQPRILVAAGGASQGSVAHLRFRSQSPRYLSA